MRGAGALNFVVVMNVSVSVDVSKICPDLNLLHDLISGMHCTTLTSMFLYFKDNKVTLK